MKRYNLNYYSFVSFLIFIIFSFSNLNCSNNEKSKMKQRDGMPIISITSSLGKDGNGNKEKHPNDFVTLPVSNSVKAGLPNDDWAQEYLNKPDPYYKNCEITVIDESGKKSLIKTPAKVKVRGNWTTSYAKKSLRIKFDEKQSLLGMNEGNKFKNWNLIASFKDRSLLRDITGYTIGKIISGKKYYVSDYKFVELYVNNEYFGVYVLVEQQEVEENRINIDNAKKNSSTQTGYLIEYDGYAYTEDPNNIFYLHHGNETDKKLVDKNGELVKEIQSGYTIKNDLNNIEQRDFIRDYMQKLWDDCYNAVYYKKDRKGNAISDVKEFVSQKIDIQSLVDTYILNEIVCDPDLYLTSFFMNIDFANNKKLTFEAPWDFDSTMGLKKHEPNEQGLFCSVVGYEVNYERSGFANPWMVIFSNEDWFNQMVQKKWDLIKDKVFTEVTNQIDKLSNQYAECFIANEERWPQSYNENIGGEFRYSYSTYKTQKTSAEYLKKWLNERKITLDKGINEFGPKDYYSAKSDRMNARATDKGILIEVKLMEGETVPEWASIVEKSTGIKCMFYKNNEWDGDGVNDCMNTAINSGETVKILFPFTEAGKSYTFAFENGPRFDSVSLLASHTVAPISFADFYNSKTICTYKKNVIKTSNEKFEATKKYLEKNKFKNVQLGIEGVAGNAAYREEGAEWGWDSNSKNIVTKESWEDKSVIEKIKSRSNKYAASTYIKFRHPATESDAESGILLHKWECNRIWSEQYKLF